jgi:hypothetical protein
MNEVNQNRSATIRGVLTDIRSIPTKTGKAFVVCKVGEHKCKLFGDLAELVLANQHNCEDQETEAYGYWDVGRRNEFVIDGFGTQPVQSATAVRRNSVSDTRPQKPAMRVDDNYVVITIPQGVTPEQLNRIIAVAKEALRELDGQIENIFGEMVNVYVTATEPVNDTGDIPF